MSRAVLGGGISGLSAAFYLTKSQKDTIKLFEATDRVGGWIKTAKSKNGSLFELGPRLVRSNVQSIPSVKNLIDQLDLAPEIKVPPSRKIVTQRMIYLNNQLVKVPTGILSLFRISPPFIKPFIHGIIKDFKTPMKVVEDESVYDFVSRRFGERYAETLLSALICGVFAGDAKDISVRALWAKIVDLEQNHGGVCKGIFSYYREVQKELKAINLPQGYSVLWTLNNGLQTLPDVLGNHLKQQDNCLLYLNNECSNLIFRNGKAILNINGREEEVKHVYSSLPSKNLAKILGSDETFLKSRLLSIPFVSVGVVNLEYSGDVLEKSGFGLLVPPCENLPVLGITFDSCIFPQEGKTVLTVMMGGKWFEQHFGSNPKEEILLETALEHVRKILGIQEKPTDSLVTIAKDCLPQYVVGHSKKVNEIRQYIAKKKLPLTILGNSFDGVGVANAIMSADIQVKATLS